MLGRKTVHLGRLGYSGALLAVLAVTVRRGDFRGLIAFVILVAAVWFKLQREERWMGEAFGPADAKYQAQVTALVPYAM